MIPNKKLAVLSLGVVSLTFALFWIVDQPLAFFIQAHLSAVEPFFHNTTGILETVTGYGLSKWTPGLVELAIGAALFFTVRQRQWGKIFFFAGTTFLATRLVTGVMKNIPRIRPHELVETGGYGPTFFVDGGNSFPSGHVAHFWGLFLPFFLLFPRYRLLFGVVPVFVFLDRVIVNDHYLSDVIVSAYLTFVFAVLFARAYKIELPFQPRE